MIYLLQNFNSTKDPVICSLCLDSLNTHSSFLKSCLDVQEKINTVCEDKVESNLVCTKTEEIEIKTEIEEDR